MEIPLELSLQVGAYRESPGSRVTTLLQTSFFFIKHLNITFLSVVVLHYYKTCHFQQDTQVVDVWEYAPKAHEVFMQPASLCQMSHQRHSVRLIGFSGQRQ